MSTPVAPGGASFPPNFSTANRLTEGTTPSKRIAQVDRSKVDPKLIQGAEGMEAMFLDELMRVMRTTVPKDEMGMDSQATEIYQGMMDSEIAQRASHGSHTGLADQIIAYLQPESYTGRQGTPSPTTDQRIDPSNSRRTGGTHAGQSAK